MVGWIAKIVPFFILEKYLKDISADWITLKDNMDKEVRVRILWLDGGTALIYDDKQEKLTRLKQARERIRKEIEQAEGDD